MKDFNLEKALQGERVIARCGFKVKHVGKYTSTVTEKDELCASIQDELHIFDIDGTSRKSRHYDLFMDDTMIEDLPILPTGSHEKVIFQTQPLLSSVDTLVNYSGDKIDISELGLKSHYNNPYGDVIFYLMKTVLRLEQEIINLKEK